MASLEARVIEVPIDNSNDVLEIDCSQLPSHAAEICDILENEGSALRFYQLFALEYYKQGHIEEAVVALKRGMANAKANDQTAKVPLLNLLASIYVQKAKSTSVVGGDRDIMLKMATALLTEAERIDRTEPNTHLIAGMLDLAKRQPDAALRHFDAALRAAPRSVAALLGRARVLFSKHRYQHALEAYQQVLVLRPSGSSRPDPRIGIGLCLHKLGHADDARRALLRAAEVDPAAAAPHILLATMDLNAVKRLLDPRIDAAAPPGAGLMSAGAGELLRRAMGQLQAAYERQPASAATLIRLADRLFFQSKYDAARGLAERALAAADTMAIQAEAHYQAARAHHAARRFDLAYDAYQRCVAINDRHHLARYGLGQMQLHRTDMSSAEATFQRVLDAHPRCVEVLRALGYLHARLPNTKAKALEYYEREMHVLAEDASASEAALCFTDANLFLEAGLLYEASSARRARTAYAMAADILQRGGGDASRLLPELWNNLGALGQLAGADDAAVFADYDCAARKCTAALADARARLAELRRGGGAAAAHGSSAAAAGARGAAAGEVQRLESTRATLSYNVARFYERRGMWARAEALYARLLADVPTYVDATLRLAHVAFFVRADADRALALVAQAIDVDSKRAAAWLLRGNIELHRQHVQDARRAFEHVLKDIAKHDVYALCSLGNFYLAAGRSEHARGSSGDATADPAAAKRANDLSAQSYKRALEFFDKCLQLDERCAAAAHGTAIALAERGCAHEARQVFQDVRDAATAGLGPPTLCSTASDLVFKGAAAAAAARHSLPPPPAPPVPQASGAEGCDVLLWSGINAAHALVDTGNYRQAVLAYEASLRRLQDSSSSSARADEAADEAADDSTSPAALSRFVVSALEAPKPGAAETEPPL
ncbi:protein required for normal CLN1 and CLN2 G1 cyclin expression, partial [Coemansia sp. RSA 1836]